MVAVWDGHARKGSLEAISHTDAIDLARRKEGPELKWTNKRYFIG